MSNGSRSGLRLDCWVLKHDHSEQQLVNFFEEMYLSGQWRANHIGQVAYMMQDRFPAMANFASNPEHINAGGNAARTSAAYAFFGEEGAAGSRDSTADGGALSE